MLLGSNWSGGSWKVLPQCVHRVMHNAVTTRVIDSCAWICTRYAAAARLSVSHAGVLMVIRLGCYWVGVLLGEIDISFSNC